MKRVSIETAASLLGISARLLRQRIERHNVLTLLGGPGPQAVALDEVLQYLDAMPPTAYRKMTNIEKLSKSLADTRSKIARTI